MLAIVALHLASAAVGAARASESWTPAILTDKALHDVYLPDFSYAGYHWGEQEPPHPEATLDVTDFGAIPDDGEDDTGAILAAVAAANAASGPVVLQFPAGRFILRDILYLERSNLILRGAGSGPDGTVLDIPIALKDLPRPAALDELQEYLIRNDRGDKSAESFTSVYSWMGGFIWPRVPGKRIYPYLPEFDVPSEILARALEGKRGEHQLTVDRPSRLTAGAQTRLEWYNTDGERGSLLEHLYMSKEVPIGSRNWQYPERALIFQDVTITAIDGDRVTIKEPLLHDLRPAWHTALTATPLLGEVGIEELRIEFPETPYGGHHREAGYNAIYLTSVTQSWVRDVTIVNADSGILSDDASQTTIEDVRVTGRPMHYGVHLGRVSGMLAKHIEIAASAQHSLSFNTYCKGSVFTDVDVLVDARLDQHRGSNHQNLFDNIRIFRGERQAEDLQARRRELLAADARRFQYVLEHLDRVRARGARAQDGPDQGRKRGPARPHHRLFGQPADHLRLRTGRLHRRPQPARHRPGFTLRIPARSAPGGIVATTSTSSERCGLRRLRV